MVRDMLLPSAITCKTNYVASGMPALGFDRSAATAEWPLRVDCLKCKGNRYSVGIAPKESIKERLQQHFESEGASVAEPMVTAIRSERQ